MEKSAKVDGLQFKWGKKRGTGAENKGVQFYESFTYGGSEYCLYDCVSIGYVSRLGSPEFFVEKIINMWEYNDQRPNPRTVELLWFFKPFELSSQIEGVQDVLANELFLASGTGLGLTNENQLETISGKCNVLCISKDGRNPQPSDEEIKSADFLFRQTFDVGTSRILEKIDDKIAGVDVKFIFNRTSCEKKASVVQKVATDVQGTADTLKPNHPSTSGSVRQNERNASDFPCFWKSDYGYKKEKDNERHKQLATKKSTRAEERSNKDSGRRDCELDCFGASGSMRNDCHVNKDEDNEAESQLSKQKSRLVEERCSKDSHCLNDTIQKKRRLDGSVEVSDGMTKESQKIRNDGRKDRKPIRKDVMVEKSRLAEERCSKDSSCLDDMLRKKRRLDGDIAVSDKRRKEPQSIRNNGRKDTEPIRKDVMVEKSRLAEERRCKKFYGLDDMPLMKRWIHGSAAVSDGRTKESQNISHDGRKDIQRTRKDVMVEKSRLAGERCSKDSYHLDYMPQKKLELNGSAAVSDARTKMSQKISHDGRKELRDKVTRGEEHFQKPSFTDKNQDLRIPRFSEGKDTRPATKSALFKKSSLDCKVSKHPEEKMLTDADYRRHYRVFEVTQKPNVEESKWYRKLTWEENLRCAEGQGNLVLLRNLDPSYTSNEVELLSVHLFGGAPFV